MSAITHVGVVMIHCKDQDVTANWFVEKLGFIKTADQPMGPDMRWVSVAPPNAATQLSLMAAKGLPPHIKSQAGEMINPCIFEVADFEQSCAALKARGVKFTIEPQQQPWGWWAEIEDPDGNSFGLHG